MRASTCARSAVRANGHLLSGVTQEIDIESGKLLFEWDSWDRTHPPVPLTETYQKFGVGDGGNGTEATPYNYFHINSVCDAGDGSGDLLISARNTWAVYRRQQEDRPDHLAAERQEVRFHDGTRAAISSGSTTSGRSLAAG